MIANDLRRLTARALLRLASAAGGAALALADALVAASNAVDVRVPCPLCGRPCPSAEIEPPIPGGVEDACSRCYDDAMEGVAAQERVRCGSAGRDPREIN